MNLRSKIFKFLLGVIVGLSICVLLTLNGLLVWVATEPRSLSALTPYIENALKPADQSFSVKIGETWLIWDGWRHPIDIRLKEVAVITGDGQLFSQFPKISLGVDLLSLPLGKVVPTSFTISEPSISLIQHDDHSLSIGFKKEDTAETAPIPFAALIAPLWSQDSSNPFSKLESITIRDAKVSISNSKGLFFSADNGNISLKRNDSGQIVINSQVLLHYAEQQAGLKSEFVLGKDQPTIDGVVEFDSLVPDMLASLFSNNPYIQSLTVPISGKALLSIAQTGDLQTVSFDVHGGKGALVSSKFIKPLPITSFTAKGVLTDSLQHMKLDECKVDLDGILFSASGEADIHDNDPEVNAFASLDQVPGDSAASLWPLGLAPMTREWVTDNIRKGTVPHAEVKVALKKGDTKLKYLPKESVDATINIDGMQVRYLPNHPPVTNAKGAIHVDGLALDATITSGDYLTGMKLNNGRVLIEDLNPDNPYIKLSLSAEGPASDMVHFLGLPKLEHAERLNLNENTISGTVKGSANLGFYFFDSKDSPIAFDINADIAAVSQPAFMQKFDLTAISGNVKINEKGIDFSGSGNVNGATSREAKVRYMFKPEKGYDTFIDVDASTPVENLKRFGYPEFSFLKGAIDVKASVKTGDNAELSQATIDLVNAELDWQDFGLKKPLKEQATFDITVDKQNGALSIPAFSLQGKDLVAKGSAGLANDFSSVNKLELSRFNNGSSDIDSLSYAITGDAIILNVKAKTIDLTRYMDKDDNSFSFANFPAIQLSGDVDTLILGKERVVNELKGTLDCNKNICMQADMSGKVGEQKPFTIKIQKNANGIRQLNVQSEDGGALLHTIGAFDGMEGGDLSVSGDYTESENGSTLEGHLVIGEHVIKEAPVLAKILSLASLTGFIDTLQGNGIRFSKLKLPFKLYNDVITITDGKTHGDAIGMTVEGTITFPKKTLDLNGTVVPSYNLNTAIDKVPVVGDILTGGKGEGVFAARYSISGTPKDTDVGVNPLSMLTPGFLRGLFDAFDEPKDAQEGRN